MITIENHKDKENYGVNIYIECERNRNHFDLRKPYIQGRYLLVNKNWHIHSSSRI